MQWLLYILCILGYANNDSRDLRNTSNTQTWCLSTTTTWGEDVHGQYLPLLWLVRQSGAAAEPNDVILKNLMTSHCFNPIP